MNNQIALILGMMLVTYIPRLIPFTFISNISTDRLSDKLRRFLKFIPYTALGALIIPGVLSATPQMPMAAITGIAFAAIIGWYRGGIILPVLGSILVTYIMLLVSNGGIL